MDDIASRYRIEAYDGDGNLLADLSTRHQGLTFKKTKNRADALTLSFGIENIDALCKQLNTTVSDLFQRNINEIRLYRDDALVGAGEVSYLQASIDDDRQSISVNVPGWLEKLAARTTGLSGDSDWIFTSTDAGQIAWGLIDATQSLANGDMGITQGTIQASITRDRTDYDLTNVLDAVIALTEVENGFDMEITPDKKFNVYYPKIGQQRPDIVLSWPGNIKRISYAADGSLMANKIHAIGSGNGADRSYETAQDTGLQAVYGLREKKITLSDVSTDTVLTEHANEELNADKVPIIIPSVELRPGTAPFYGDYGIGDEVTIAVDDYANVFDIVNGQYRIETITLQVDVDGRESVSLGLSR